MSTERILDEIHTDIRELRGEVKELHKEVIVLKTEKKVSIAFLTVIVSTITTFLYKIFDISIR
jgi:hypothetical protein